jgi:hypothetical protein
VLQLFAPIPAGIPDVAGNNAARLWDGRAEDLREQAEVTRRQPRVEYPILPPYTAETPRPDITIGAP